MKLIITAKQSSKHDLWNAAPFKTTEAMGLQDTELMKAGGRPTFFLVLLSVLTEAERKTRLGNYI